MELKKKNDLECGCSEFLKNKVARYNKSKGTLQDYNCDKCNNRGDIAIIIDDGAGNYYESLIECECMKIRRTLSMIKVSGLSKAFERYQFENYQTENELQANIKNKALDYLVNGLNDWWYIGGQVGSGKTHICTAIVREKIKNFIPTRYIVWSEAIDEIKNQLRQNNDLSVKMEELKRVELLYIDDLLKYEPTKFELQVLFDIINYRYNNELQTIISSEKSVNEIIKIDEAIGSRIFERAKRYCLNVEKDESKNWRKKV